MSNIREAILDLSEELEDLKEQIKQAHHVKYYDVVLHLDQDEENKLLDKLWLNPDYQRLELVEREIDIRKRCIKNYADLLFVIDLSNEFTTLYLKVRAFVKSFHTIKKEAL